MFKPTFTITNKTARYLTEVAEARGVILTAPLIPKWELDLRRQALIRSTHASTSIEGNRLSLDEVTDLMVGREITASYKDKQEVLNYFEALDYIGTLTNKPLTESDILKLHSVITKDVMRDAKDTGRYRTPEAEAKRGRVVVAERDIEGKQRSTFIPPEAKDVPVLMGEFVAWLNSAEAEELDAVIEAGAAHYEFVRIHPFVDGNGRTSRTLASYVLLRRGFDTKRFFALDDYYNADRGRYYEALQTVDPDNQDLTEWLEYFCEGVAVSTKAVKDKVLALTGGKEGKAGEQIALDNRQARVVEFIQQEGQIANRHVRELLSISHEAANDLLQALVKSKVIKRVGQGRATHYILG